MVLQPNDPQQAQAWVRGAPPDAVIDFYIPRGNEGEPGPRGPIGPSLGVGSVTTVSDPADVQMDLVDPNQAQVGVKKNLDELDFEFYVPATPTQAKNFAIAMAIAL